MDVKYKVREIFKNTPVEVLYSTDDGEIWIRKNCAEDYAKRLLEAKHPKTGLPLYTDLVLTHEKIQQYNNG